MNVDVSIVMTYYERLQQLKTTLDSFSYHSYGSNVEIIIVDDGSVEHPASSLGDVPGLSILYVYLEPHKKWYSNSCIPFNVGLRLARGDVIIIQNAECFHYDNIVQHALRNVGSHNYLTYACFSLPRREYERTLEMGDFRQVRDSIRLSQEKAVGDGGIGWYNHSLINPRALHFCAAIRSSNIKRLNGFDEHYARGYCFDDDEFLFRIKRLGLSVLIEDSCVVVHQWHYTEKTPKVDWDRKYNRNQFIFREITSKNRPFFLFFFLYSFPRFFSSVRSILHGFVRRFILRGKT